MRSVMSQINEYDDDDVLVVMTETFKPITWIDTSSVDNVMSDIFDLMRLNGFV